MADTHPMHSWDDDTRDGVRAHLEYQLADIAPHLDAARERVQDVERRLGAGEAVGRDERVEAHAVYRRWDDARETTEGQRRALDVRTIDSFDQPEAT